MSERRAVVIAVDGLRASALGPYGNTWHPTPVIDALAAQSVLVEWMYRESASLEEFYRTLWGGGAPLRHSVEAPPVAGAVVTDDARVAAWAHEARFAEVIELDLPAGESAEEVEGTELAALMAVAAQQLTREEGDMARSPRLLWIHARGLHGPWDAPRALREALLDEGDPEAPDFVAPPHLVATRDSDALLQIRVAYAAQVMALDDCIGGLLAALRESGREAETLVVLVGCRGYALGEHGVAGGNAAPLYSVLLHVPCLVRIPGGSPAPMRRDGLATPRDLAATLSAWFGAEVASDGTDSGLDLLDPAAPPRVAVCATGPGERSVRTPAWFLRACDGQQGVALPTGSGPMLELYAKPDDRWELNEIANRCGDVAERLLALAAAGETAANAPGGAIDADLIQAQR
ncbi:MAG TPA: sulfatase-like hydrolase/transferase [Lacipirellulaceae bacterium]|nr:sulfatase-like hydrolase/transferase [Lacipirellulaceae bacterium]